MSKIHLVNCRFLDSHGSRVYTFATMESNLRKGDIVESSRGGRMEVIEYTTKVPPQQLVALNKRYLSQLLPYPPDDVLKNFQKEKHRDDEIAELRKQIAVLKEKLKEWEGYR